MISPQSELGDIAYLYVEANGEYNYPDFVFSAGGPVNLYIYNDKAYFQLNSSWLSSPNLKMKQPNLPKGQTACWVVIEGRNPFARNLAFSKAVANWLHDSVELGKRDVPGDLFTRLHAGVVGTGEQALCGDYSVFHCRNSFKVHWYSEQSEDPWK